MSDALFTVRGDELVPTGLSRGPWSPDNLHGGPVAALLARELESREPDRAMQVVRVTVDFLRPVLLAPLGIESRLSRPGRRVQVLDARAFQSGALVATARALRIRVSGFELPGTVPPDEVRRFAGPDESLASVDPDAPEAFHSRGAELRFAQGEFGVPGPACAWVRLRCPVVEEEEPSPLQRALAAADFGNGVSSSLPYGEWLFINPDLTVYLDRMPETEWVCLDGHTYPRGTGLGLSESRLWDVSGPIGRSVQSLFIEPVGKR